MYFYLFIIQNRNDMKLTFFLKYLSFFVFVVMLLAGCSDKDNEDPTPDPDPIDVVDACQLTSVTYDNEEYTYTFDESGFVSKTAISGTNDQGDYGFDIIYTYDGNGKLIKEEYFDNGALFGYMTYTYENGLISYTENYYLGELEYTHDYSYDSNKRLIKTIESSGYIVNYKYNSDGNVTEETTYNDEGSLTEKIVYENYDDKLIPLAATKGLTLISLEANTISKGSSKNNPGKVTYTYYDSEGGSEEFVLNYTYQYNSNNLPVRVKQSTSEGEVYFIDYAYKCG